MEMIGWNYGHSTSIFEKSLILSVEVLCMM